MGRERRRHARVKVEGNCGITCTDEAGTGANLALRLVDISSKGACIASASRLRPGDAVRVEVVMPNLNPPFASRAFVRWSQVLEGRGAGESYLAGLEFDATLPLPTDRAEGDPHVLETLHNLRVSVAQLRLYPKDSPQVLKVVTDTYHSIHTYLEQSGILTLSRTPRGLLVNGRPLSASGKVAESLENSTLGLLAEVQIKSMTVKKGVTMEELITFLHALTRKFWDVKEGKEINRRLRDERVFQISVDEVQYVALGAGDIVIEDAARKLQGGQSEVGRLLESLDQIIESASGSALSEGRVHLMKRLLDQDPGLLRKVGKEGVVEEAEREDDGRLPFEQAREALAALAGLLREAPPSLRGAILKAGQILAGAFSRNPKLHAVLSAVMTEKASEGLRDAVQEAADVRPAVPAPILRGQEILSLPDEQRVQALAQEGGKLLDELSAMDQKDLFKSLVGSVTPALGERHSRHRLAGAKALLGLRRVIEKAGPDDLVRDLEAKDRAALDQEKDASVYPALAEMASFLADLRIRREALGDACETLDLLNRHYHIKDPAYAQRSEQAYVALERVASGIGFSSMAEKIRAGDPSAVRVLESLDAAATRFLIGEIKKAETNARRLHFAQFIARAGMGAATILVDEIQKTASPTDVMRLIEVLPHSMPVDMAELALGALIRHPAVAVRRRAAVMMAELAYPRAGHLLMEAFHEEKDLATQLVCIECLGKLRYKGSVETLLEAVEDRAYADDLRSAMCLALGRIGDARAVPVLVKMVSRGGWGGLTKIIRNVPPAVRAAAVRALALFTTQPEAREALREALEDKDAAVRFAAGQARLAPLFESFGEPAQGAQMASSVAELRKLAVKTVGTLSEIPVDPLMRAAGVSETTGLLLLNFKGPVARIYLDAGLVISVDFEGRKDREAFAQLLARKDGYFLFLPGEAAPDRRILVPPDALLTETAKLRVSDPPTRS